MNDIDEFIEVALAIFVAITGLIVLLTYLEQTLNAPAKVHAQPVRDRLGARGGIQQWWRRRRSRRASW